MRCGSMIRIVCASYGAAKSRPSAACTPPLHSCGSVQLAAFAVLDILHRDVLLGAARRVDDEDGILIAYVPVGCATVLGMAKTREPSRATTAPSYLSSAGAALLIGAVDVRPTMSHDVVAIDPTSSGATSAATCRTAATRASRIRSASGTCRARRRHARPCPGAARGWCHLQRRGCCLRVDLVLGEDGRARSPRCTPRRRARTRPSRRSSGPCGAADAPTLGGGGVGSHVRFTAHPPSVPASQS